MMARVILFPSRKSSEATELLAEGVRWVEGRLSLLDIIQRRAKGKAAAHPSVALQRLLKRSPELKERVLYSPLPGQRTTPTIAADEVSWVLRLLEAPAPKLGRKSKKPPTLPLLVRQAAQRSMLALVSETEPTPFGWRRDAGESILSPVIVELQLVSYVKKRRALGHLFQLIAAELNEQGILQRGQRWGAEDLELVITFDHQSLLDIYARYLRRWESFDETIINLDNE